MTHATASRPQPPQIRAVCGPPAVRRRSVGGPPPAVDGAVEKHRDCPELSPRGSARCPARGRFGRCAEGTVRNSNLPGDPAGQILPVPEDRPNYSSRIWRCLRKSVPIFLAQILRGEVISGRRAYDGNSQPYSYGIFSPDAAPTLHRHAGTLDMLARK